MNCSTRTDVTQSPIDAVGEVLSDVIAAIKSLPPKRDRQDLVDSLMDVLDAAQDDLRECDDDFLRWVTDVDEEMQNAD